MVKTVYIKLTKVSPTAGPFNIYDQWNNLIAENVSRQSLIDGVGYILDWSVTMIRLISIGDCPLEKIMPIVNMTEQEFFNTPTTIVSTGCVYKHLTDPVHYNYYYGNIEPYIIEYPFSFSPQDQILQSFKSYDKVYQYIADSTNSYSYANKIAVDDIYFNKIIAYNDQQSSGILEIVPKPLHNLKLYMTYPIYNSDSRTITYTKSDNFYQINGIYDIVRDKSVQLFIPSCESLSIDKEPNQSNLVYTQRSFTKPLLRAKDSKIRFYLTDRGDVKIVSQFIISDNQISYK
jgi:hypothetical protein